MNVTNGERLATKQDLADMYQGILPYLGGMPEIVANKFSKGDLYDTSEKMIGQWINGKPLYQRSYSFNSPSVDSTYTNVADLDDISYETLYIKSAFLNDTRNKTIYDIPLLYNLSYFGNIILRPESKKIQMIVNSSGYINFPCVCTVCYTKTTDSAISIGDETDYSTDEKIVGTWIDEKPLFQRTIEVTNTTTNIDSIIGNNIGIIKKENVMAIRTDNATIDSEFMLGSNDFLLVLVQKYNNSCSIMYNTTIQYSKVYVTIQYTKTT